MTGETIKQEQALGEPKRELNWRIWTGFSLALTAVPAYFLFFWKVSNHERRTVAELVDVRRYRIAVVDRSAQGFRQPEVYRGKIAGPILAVLSLGAAGLFAYATLYASRQLPAAAGAPAVGDKAPEFALADTSGRMVALSTLLSEPMPRMQAEKPRGVLLVFYRGY